VLQLKISSPRAERREEPFTVAFTDIQSSTKLWSNAPADMAAAIEIHHREIRKVIAKYRGYEVKTVGDSFMVAFSSACDAVHFAVGIQAALFNCKDWSPAINQLYATMLSNKDDTPPNATDADMWNGLRVRVGVHTGMGQINKDPVSLSYDYYGTVVNCAARVLSK